MASLSALRIAARYSEIFHRADTEPYEALQDWHDMVRQQGSKANLPLHRRALRILVKRLHGDPPTDVDAALGAAITRAWSAVREAEAAAAHPDHRSMGFTLVEPDVAELPMTGATQDRRLLTDVSDLEREVESWSDQNWCDWLLSGFDEVLAGSSEAYSAFPPLRLYPVGNYLAQLSDALTDGQPFGSVVPDHACSALRHLLENGGVRDGRDTLSWELFGAFSMNDPNASTARRYAIAVAVLGWTIPAETLDQLCRYAWKVCVNETARSDFFKNLSGVEPDLVLGWRSVAELEDAAAEFDGDTDQIAAVASDMLSKGAFEATDATAQIEWILAHDGLREFSSNFGPVDDIAHLHRRVEDLAQSAPGAGWSWAAPHPVNADAVLEEFEGV